MSRLLVACVVLLLSAVAQAGERPNILWITAEDMSATLGCYGDAYARTPQIDRLAARSIRYTQAFATAPVCSPSRSCLITGCYATSLGTHNMRSAFPLPDFMRGFPALLRDAGYYTTNHVKSDYNTSSEAYLIRESWDDSSATAHWRNRPRPEQPFFSVFNLMVSHQSRTMVWPREQFVAEVQSRLKPSDVHDPVTAPVPPYYPDTPVVRRTVARYYDCVTVMDQEVGKILEELKADGLEESTIVFFFSDHGSGMPRHKRVLLDSGMHVPLLVHLPSQFRGLAPAGSGSTATRLVSFVDFGPSVLSLAGVAIPDFMQGQPFLGEAAVASREFVYGHRDRIDEVFDMARSVRDGQYLYIRNYMPHLGYNQPSAWPDAGEIMGEFFPRRISVPYTDAQRQFAGPTRDVEELYDCEADPLNLRNLAGDPEHAATLQRMRQAHRAQVLATGDLGFLPESLLWWFPEGKTPWEQREVVADALETLFSAAQDVGVGNPQACLDNLRDEGVIGVKYWGALGLAATKRLPFGAAPRLIGALQDRYSAVRIEAANALARHERLDVALPALIAELDEEDLTEVLHAMRTIELIGEPAAAARPAVRKLLERLQDYEKPAEDTATFKQPGAADLVMFIRFSAEAFLRRLGG